MPVSITAVFVSSMLTDVGRAVRAASGEAATPALLYAATFFFLALTGARLRITDVLRLGLATGSGFSAEILEEWASEADRKGYAGL